MTRLRKLKAQLQEKNAMLMEYDKIFKIQLLTGIIEPVPQLE